MNITCRKYWNNPYRMNFTISRPTGDINLALPDPSYFIYKFTNTVNDKVYIGSTNNPARRVEEHLTGKGSTALLADLVVRLHYPAY